MILEHCGFLQYLTNEPHRRCRQRLSFSMHLPTRLLTRGDSIKVPYVIGSMIDEGTSWVPYDSSWT